LFSESEFNAKQINAALAAAVHKLYVFPVIVCVLLKSSGKLFILLEHTEKTISVHVKLLFAHKNKPIQKYLISIT
jgi:hypothetical protein